MTTNQQAAARTKFAKAARAKGQHQSRSRRQEHCQAQEETQQVGARRGWVRAVRCGKQRRRSQEGAHSQCLTTTALPGGRLPIGLPTGPASSTTGKLLVSVLY